MLREQKRFVVTAGLIGIVLLILGGGMACILQGYEVNFFRGCCYTVAVCFLLGGVVGIVTAVGYSLACFYEDAGRAEKRRADQR